ncbi:MAG: 3-dehydroquinate synthase [Chloroflexi bacterium]|nr:MAG: 3-dehydroquinate synthase [Phototrophicales bacterium]RMF78406.1 MAG: 3-dehydroquinate synthase [Chloroflexota bacterium]
MAERISVTSPDGDYDIVIERGLLQRIGRDTDQFGLDSKVVVVTNETVAPLYGEALVQSLPDATLITIRDGEAYKTLETVAQLYDAFVDAGLDRAGIVIALGGGVVGDTVGFAAASYMRGVRLVQMPTSLLAMVDSSVGGKVGVDLPQGKNLVGAFKQPAMVLIDPDVLQTLPPRQWRCGMAEVIKHGLLADEGLLDSALHTPERAAELVRRAIQVKIDVVEADPYEDGTRAHLNLGHTFGHAIERVTDYKMLHGEAVAIGLMAAARLSYNLELCDDSLIPVVKDVLESAGLPIEIGDLNPTDIYEAMFTDKKWKHGRSHFVLLRGIGQPTIVQDVPREIVIETLSNGDVAR